MSSLISIIIPAYNSEKTITQTLQAVVNQQDSFQKEIIVVDDGSTDTTAKLIRSWPAVSYHHQINAGPASARNRGVKEAHGDLIVFTDADCVPHADWIEKIISGFKDDQIAVVAGSYDIANPGSLLARCIHREIMFRHQHLVPEFPRVFGSYNFCIRKEVFNQLGGFETTYPAPSGEDNDLSYKVLKSGLKIYFNKGARVKHFYPTCLKQYLREQYRHGRFRVKMYLEHPRMSGGDDYTFWKDIAEVGCVLVMALSFFLTLVYNPRFFLVGAVLFSGLLVLEFFYAFLMGHGVKERLFLTLVMFSRAFFRTAGLLVGIFQFLPEKILKKNK